MDPFSIGEEAGPVAGPSTHGLLETAVPDARAGTYILDVRVAAGSARAGVLTSTETISLYDCAAPGGMGLATALHVPGAQGFRFGRAEAGAIEVAGSLAEAGAAGDAGVADAVADIPWLVFATAGTDGAVRMWDLRAPPSEGGRVCVAWRPGGVTAFDVAAGGHMLVTGSPVDMDLCSAPVCLWDVRMAAGGAPPKPMATFGESHTDEVTAIRCHPRAANVFLSCAEDGLVSAFVLNAGARSVEEESVECVLNTRQSPAMAEFARVPGPGGMAAGGAPLALAVTSHAETAGLWSVDTAALAVDWPDVRARARTAGAAVNSLIGFTHRTYVAPGEGGAAGAGGLLGPGLLLLGTEGDGTLAGLALDPTQPAGVRQVLRLAGGHEDHVRAVAWLGADRIITGGEDGRVCVWGGLPESPAAAAAAAAAPMSPQAEQRPAVVLAEQPAPAMSRRAPSSFASRPRPAPRRNPF
ncbi:hypothetical protein H696_04711 [Fonticula alba]|uniref:Uncharacterized protein n=1 Tax=Fonticula alba TaxID=691883 RepID=A0A058Z4I0_FONAL|nr:hypothetical protein H696_04711 [Fonticula alba]KCV68417.1 hypothetical protein H696_04711 [Fonticula alba]|eukprot:XP_009496849.1 hypothetical protein H696_04711 [Fonticula alba]